MEQAITVPWILSELAGGSAVGHLSSSNTNVIMKTASHRRKSKIIQEKTEPSDFFSVLNFLSLCFLFHGLLLKWNDETYG